VEAACAGRDVIWNMNHSRVAENILISAALRCLPAHVTRRSGGRTGSVSAGAAAALRQLRQMCPHSDTSVACRVPDPQRCHGCETGDISPSTPLEHCCGDSCPSCNHSDARCLPPSVYFGDPLVSVRSEPPAHRHSPCAPASRLVRRTLSLRWPTHGPTAQGPARRDALEAYLAQKERDTPPEMQPWRKLTGRPQAASTPRHADRHGERHSAKAAAKATKATKASGKAATKPFAKAGGGVHLRPLQHGLQNKTLGGHKRNKTVSRRAAQFAPAGP
jgi:hypothetical protein